MKSNEIRNLVNWVKEFPRSTSQVPELSFVLTE